MIRTSLTAVVLCILATYSARAEYSDHRGRKIDSLEAVLKSGRPLSDEDRMNAYRNLMKGYGPIDGRKAEEYARKALALSYTMNATNSRVDALYNIGLQAYGKDDYDTAADYFQQALAVNDSMTSDKRYEQSVIDDNASQLYGALGNLYNIQDQAQLAITYYQRALPIFERYGWLESQCILYHNIGELYSPIGNNEKAKENFLKAIEKGDQTGDSLMMAMPRKGIAKIYIDENDYEHAKEAIEYAYNYYRTHYDEDPGDYCTVLCELTRLHKMDGHRDLTKARHFAMQALDVTKRYELMTEVAFDAYAATAEVAMAEGNWHEALGYALQSVHEDDANATFTDVGCFQLLAIIYMQLGDKEKALLYINKVRELSERFANENYQSGISQMEVLYETEKKQTAIEQLAREKEFQAQQNRQLTKEKRLMTWAGTLGGIILLLLAVLFFVLWRSVVLSKRNATVKAKLDGEIAERVRLSRDLHDRMGGLLSAIKNAVPEESAAARLTDDAVAEMRNVAHHLLPDSLRRYGLRTALRDFCMTLKNVSFAFMGTEQRIDKQQEEIIYCSVYELVNNAVRCANASHIRVQLMAEDDYIAVNVSDDGDGISNTNDKDGDTPTGHGLRNIRERVETGGGSFSLYTKAGEGTEINIEFKRH